MSRHDYEVIGAGHTHAGQALTVGQTVQMHASEAALYPAIFQLKRAPSAKAERSTRSPKSAPLKPADAGDRTAALPSNED